jgi:hypothetical protein
MVGTFFETVALLFTMWTWRPWSLPDFSGGLATGHWLIAWGLGLNLSGATRVPLESRWRPVGCLSSFDLARVTSFGRLHRRTPLTINSNVWSYQLLRNSKLLPSDIVPQS